MSIPLVKTECLPHECGWTKNKGYFNFPLFLMGCPGRRGAVMNRVTIYPVDTLDFDFWDILARNIQTHQKLDFDWESLRKNVILPNEAHIREVCKIPSDKCWQRFVEDGYVFLCCWFNKDTPSEDEDGNPCMFKMPNKERVFTDEEAEY